MVAKFITPNDSCWREALAKLPHDFYHLPEYAQLCATYEFGTAAAFYAENASSAFLAPLVIRTIPVEFCEPEKWYDCVSPYGYSTPVITPSQNGLESFLEAFWSVARQHHIVTAFFRLHPLVPLRHEVLRKFGQLVKHGPTVYIDLSRTEQEIWAQTSTNHKRNIQRLLKLEFSVTLDDWHRLNDFVRIYHMTMQRVGASKAYLFSPDYFQALQATLGHHLHLCCVLSPRGELCAAGLFVETNGVVQYHLGATITAFLPLAPSKLMFDFMWRWAKARSCRIFHFGGGVAGVRDSLFDFKAGFSKDTADFFTYRMVLDEEKNETLVRRAHANGATGVHADFFPAYRIGSTSQGPEATHQLTSSM